MQLVHKYLQTGARLNPHKPSLHCDGRIVTYAEMIEAIDTIADVLIVEGIRKGDSVLVLLRDQIDLLISLYAIMRAGAIALPLAGESETGAVTEIARRYSHQALMTTRTDLRHHGILPDQLQCPFMLTDVILETRRQSTAGPDQDSVAESLRRFNRITKLMNMTDADGAIRYVSAESSTDAEPALCSHRQLVSTAVLVNKHEALSLRHTEFITAPFTDISGLQRALCLHFSGGTVVTTNLRAPAQDVFAPLAELHCNSLAVRAQEIHGIIDGGTPVSAEVLSAISCLDISGGISAGEGKQLLKLFPVADIYIHRDYAISPYATLLNLRKHPHKLETVGKALGEISISVVDEQGKLLSRPHIGEVVIRPSAQPAATWQRTGDIGYLDRDGSLHVIAQQFEMITVNGIRFSPLKMENRIRAKFGGCELSIIGVPDPAGLLGEIPVFCYNPPDGMQITSADLTRLLSENFDQYQIPRIICRMDTFPRRGTIILRQELRDRVLTALSHPQDQHQARHVQ
jgi:long-chain acyl-CoA synthetase